jgi:hypothetical protein
MPENNLIEARLSIIASKAKILAESYKNGKLWDSDLSHGLHEIETEIQAIRRESNQNRGWEYGDR